MVLPKYLEQETSTYMYLNKSKDCRLSMITWSQELSIPYA